MGQFQNQPDFATKAEEVTSLPYTPESPSAIYIGEKTDTAADASITVIMPGDSSGTFITFKNVTTGFLPVVAATVHSSTNINQNSIVLVR
ncbi:hypothetical protein N9177_00565 [bacterium]|nr:hypothetical protein [bacterium]